MLLKEVIEANKAVNRLLSVIDFSSLGPATKVIEQRLAKKGIKPTLTNIKKHLIGYLLIPIDEVPEPERTIILRSGRPERFCRVGTSIVLRDAERAIILRARRGEWGD